LKRVRALKSPTSDVKSRVPSTTGAPPLVKASTLNVARIVSRWEAATAEAMGWLGSLTRAWDTAWR
jgi:hypothetical protein